MGGGGEHWWEDFSWWVGNEQIFGQWGHSPSPPVVKIQHVAI